MERNLPKCNTHAASMNQIRQVQALNRRELEAGVSPNASWHTDYRDTAFIYIGGLPFELSEGDIVTIFSQYGEPTYVNLVRDRETGKSKGFAFLKYEDQRSTDLAVDNLGGASVMGRVVRVDHTRYKIKDGEDISDNTGGAGVEVQGDGRDGGGDGMGGSDKEEVQRPLLKEEKELQVLLREHDADDPMKEFLVQEKREEIKLAVEEYEREQKRKDKEDRTRHKRHHHSKRHEHGHGVRRRQRRSGSRSEDGEKTVPRKRSRSPRRDRYRSPRRDDDSDSDDRHRSRRVRD